MSNNSASRSISQPSFSYFTRFFEYCELITVPMSKLRSPRPLVHVGLPAPSKTRNPAPICPSQCSFTSELSTSSRSGKYFLFASPGTDCQIRMTCWAEFRLLQLLYICSEKQINYLKCNGNKRLKIEGPVDAMWNLCILPISSELTIRVE